MPHHCHFSDIVYLIVCIMQFVVYQCGFRCFMLFCLKRIAVAVFYALILMLNLVLDLDLVTLEYYLKNVYFNKNSMNII